MWLEPINASEITYKNYFGHVPSPVDKVVSFKQQNKVVQSLLADRDILVREEVMSTYKKGEETHQLMHFIRFIKMLPRHWRLFLLN
jgi:hypothetical protein